MITEIVFFDLPRGTDRVSAVALYRQSAEKWQTNPDLIEKYYFFDEARGRGGGIYIWPSRESAARWHGDEYKKMIRSLYGADPHIEILDAVLHIIPAKGETIEL